MLTTGEQNTGLSYISAPYLFEVQNWGGGISLEAREGPSWGPVREEFPQNLSSDDQNKTEESNQETR